MDNLKNINWTNIRKQATAWGNTVLWTTFLLAGFFGSLSLRGNIPLGADQNKLVGTILAIFTLYVLITLVYKAHVDNKKK